MIASVLCITEFTKSLPYFSKAETTSLENIYPVTSKTYSPHQHGAAENWPLAQTEGEASNCKPAASKEETEGGGLT
jgi:hypothetical protein